MDLAGAFAFHAPHGLTGAFGNPKRVRRPHPPVLVGGRSAPNAAGVAEHADLWNMPGGEIDDVVRRSAQRDRHCAGIGRDPRSHWPSPFWRSPPGRSR
ncbi:hypothetical protein [Streptomyces shenzhenensis]|uniref:hypothetical protein n=1 Tax=Streptomyces shenzhenensis TaxID=943815 RepID=UPI0036755E10